ncbi:hypothetical protein PM082_016606 [Marasmius tenuissimus]|nr:hypothetical protein PM082_016606 [Marasmius tenuissimus]
MKCPSQNSTYCFSLITAPHVLSSIISLLYGIYTVLYVICMYILLTRKRRSYGIHGVLTTALFIVATELLNYTIDLPAYNQNEQDTDDLQEQMWLTASLDMWMTTGLVFLTVLANCLTDSLLLWRCYIIWGCKKQIVIFPIFLCVATNAAGFFIAGVRVSPMSPAFSYFGYAIVGSNFLLTAMIACRIFLIAHRIAKCLPTRSRRSVFRMYRLVLSATLESGLLYPTALFMFALFGLLATALKRDEGRPPKLVLVTNVMFDSLMNIMGIASVLIVVRVTLGTAIQDEQTFKETILLDESSSNNQQVVDICAQDTVSVESKFKA